MVRRRGERTRQKEGERGGGGRRGGENNGVQKESSGVGG